ncbi:Amphiregulin [Heterocephalus glaber]|uniref:Amphiregulin n=1 Tax=Heterocephalus glaber TaxID=10181 RepID=G5BU11_HETGA|nr:amphiregulin [Heterocephalus glaber]EHB12769.1 Amphiregulin [Heterocephalus glaber]
MTPALLLSLLVLCSGRYATGLDLNDTDSGKGGTLLPRGHSDGGLEVTTSSEVLSLASATPSSRELSSGAEEDYSEEDDTELGTSGYIVDDSVRVEQVVKPKKNKTEGEKTSDKPKRKKKGSKNGKSRRNKKKKNPCAAEFQNFCIHGECKYLENMDRVTCQCDQDYFGERCGEKSMKTHRIAGRDLSKITLVVIAAFVLAVSLLAIAGVITVQLRKRYFRKYEGEEERKKLRQENGNAHSMA